MAVTAMMARDVISGLEHADHADIRRLLPRAQMHKTRHAAGGRRDPHRLFEMADQKHLAMHLPP